MPKYWVVGASWGGVDHQDAKFVEQGIWMLGCRPATGAVTGHVYALDEKDGHTVWKFDVVPDHAGQD